MPDGDPSCSSPVGRFDGGGGRASPTGQAATLPSTVYDAQLRLLHWTKSAPVNALVPGGTGLSADVRRRRLAVVAATRFPYAKGADADAPQFSPVAPS